MRRKAGIGHRDNEVGIGSPAASLRLGDTHAMPAPNVFPAAPFTPATARAPVSVHRLDGAQAVHAVEPLADVLIDCVEGGASVGFMAPLSRERARTFWRTVADGVQRRERVLLVAEDASGRIVGTVQLVTAQPDNQPHRADVAKMLVHRRARRAGVGALLLHALEAAARAERKTVLVLDTVTGGDAQRLYARAGWQHVGDVPGYALMPNGALCGTSFYCKHLA